MTMATRTSIKLAADAATEMVVGSECFSPASPAGGLSVDRTAPESAGNAVAMETVDILDVGVISSGVLKAAADVTGS